jgi:microcystin-dependent protein
MSKASVLSLYGLSSFGPSGSVLVSTGTLTPPTFTPISYIVPSGTILDYAGTTAPSGFLECDGSNVSRITYSDLFTAVGTTWGNGDGVNTFTLPDLRRRTLVGRGGTGTTTLSATVGSIGGVESILLTGDQCGIGSHGHRMNARTHGQTGNTPGAGFAAGLQVDLQLASGGNNGFASGAVTNYEWNTGNVITSWSSFPSSGVITSFTTGSLAALSAHNNLPPAAVTMKIIKI